ncbi:MAG: ThiF family adenylyltransferase [Nitrosomonadales bacterium]|nr:ThiF family adenylyltransferase [Nitrosomonadales bacterium]
MSWIASQPNVVEIKDGDLPLALRVVLSYLLSSSYIPKGSVKTYQTDCSFRRYVFAFNFFWDQPAKVVEERIELPESIAFWFLDETDIATPPQVRSDRMDFPRNLPHLNQVPDSEPSWLCMAREGLSSIYQRGGIPALLQRLSMWLRDAAAGQLDHDGWEPIPRSGSCSATLDIAWFQNAAFNSTKDLPGHALGNSLLFLDKDIDGNQVLHSQLVSRKKALEKIWMTELDDAVTVERRRAINSFWFMAWGKRSKASAQRYNKSISNVSDLFEFAAVSGCEDEVRNFIYVICKPDAPAQGQYYVILIGEWRPKQLIQTIPGLANGEARKLELSGFLVFIEANGTKREIGSIFQLSLLAEANADNLNKLSGFNALPNNVVLLGAGALGSKVAEHLVREGIATLTIADHDRFAPHNLSRHALTSEALYFNKAKELRTFLLGINKVLDITACDVNIASVPAGLFKDQITGKKQGALIDCSADISVMRRLCQPDNVMRTIKLEIADNGQIGLLLYEGRRRNPRIDDLKALVQYLCVEIPEISLWLNRVDDQKIDTGIGCASASMLMSDSRVSVHAANFMASVSKIVRGGEYPSGMGVALANAEGHLQDWIWIDEPSFVLFNVLPWQVRVRKSVVENLALCRDRSKPNEAGGYLYGSFDLSLKAIYVIWACEPVAIEKTPVSIKLPPAGNSEEEMQIRHTCAGRLQLLGTWHSHPDSSSQASTTDITQFISDTAAYAANPSPHLLMIVGDKNISVSLGFPPLWK